MRDVLINDARNKLLNFFQFLEPLGYELENYGVNADRRFGIHFKNDKIKKSIDFTISDSEDVDRFHITISIVRAPYVSVNDFIDFDVYLQKNNIAYKDSLEGNEINEKGIEEYIKNYSELFRRHGTQLITTDKQFPHYYPEWT